MRVERRSDPRYPAVYRVASILVGLAVALLVAPVLGSVPASDFYDLAWTGTLGSPLGLANVLTVAAPLIIAGLAASIPYRLGLWNIGIDGQILIGAWMAFGLGTLLPDLSGSLLIPLMMMAGMLGGALWALGPAVARAYLGLNEIITTFLLNFVAVAWMTYWGTGPWFDPASGGGIRSRPVPEQSELALIELNGTFVHWGIVMAAALPIGVWYALRHSRMGYELTVTGASEKAGAYAGIPVRRKLMGALVVGGAVGGLAGVVDMLGALHQYGAGLSNNTGFSAVVVAVLAGGAEIGVLVVGFVYALLIVGGDAVGLAGVSPDLVFALVGITLLLAAIGEALARLRVVRTRTVAPEGALEG
jgi:simple sugar transport system permease protein